MPSRKGSPRRGSWHEAQLNEAQLIDLFGESYNAGFRLAGQSGWNTREEAAKYAKDIAKSAKSTFSKLDFNKGWRARRPGRNA